VASFFFTALSVNAQTPVRNPITTAVPFLRLSPDARASGMGEAVVAVSPDANSAFYNVAKTAFNQKKFGLGINYTNYLQELNVDNLYQLSVGGYFKLDEMQALSFGVRHFSKGDLTFRDAQEQVLRTFKPQDLAIEAGYSRKLSDNLGLGLNLRYINSKLAVESGNNNDYKDGSAVAADLTAFYTLPSGWNFGAALTNLGSKMDYGGIKSFIPANLAIGTAYEVKVDNDNKISFALDLSKLLVPTPPNTGDSAKVKAYEEKGVVGSWFSSFGDAPGGGREELREVQIAVGTEYSYKEVLNLRAGYFYENTYKGNRQYFTVGAGLGYKVAKINLSFLLPTGSNPSFSPLTNSLKLSLLFMGK
jgi:hypothetical protein